MWELKKVAYKNVVIDGEKYIKITKTFCATAKNEEELEGAIHSLIDEQFPVIVEKVKKTGRKATVALSTLAKKIRFGKNITGATIWGAYTDDAEAWKDPRYWDNVEVETRKVHG
ncbi:MAG: hypothetical protein K6U04_08660 [Armatimonadetes bacterium]|nr:hypothetical protein [Armatimonadota bacterium]